MVWGEINTHDIVSNQWTADRSIAIPISSFENSLFMCFYFVENILSDSQLK